MGEYKPNENEELLKTHIYNSYLELLSEESSDRRQVNYVKCFELIFKWCRFYLYRKMIKVDGLPTILADEMSKEIGEVVNRINKEKTFSQKDKNYFFSNLRVSLENAKNQYYRDRISAGSIKISKRAKEINELLRWEESTKEKKLTLSESINCISRWFSLSEKSSRDYIMGLYRQNTSGLEFESINNDDNGIYALNIETSKPPYMENSSEDPQNEFLENIDKQALLQAIIMALEKTQSRTRAIKRALYTLYIIEKESNYNYLLPILDTEIVELWERYKKEDKILTQYEIYWKYHPEVTQKSAEISASTLLKHFRNDMKYFLKNVINHKV